MSGAARLAPGQGDQTSFLPPSAADTLEQARVGRLIQQIESLEGDIAALKAEVAAVYANARASRVNVKALRKLIALRRCERAVVDRYLRAAAENA